MFNAWPKEEDTGEMQSGLVKGSYIDANGKEQTALLFNADFINTGALRVGPDYIANGKAQDPKADATLYADISSKEVYLAGWTVDKQSITTGDLGETGFHIYSSGSTISKSIADSGNKTNWRLAIGSNFGVDSTGALYASAGKIGNMTIGDIEQMGVKNLITFFTYPITIMHHLPAVSDWNTNHLTWTLTKN
jgi:hypothetical protein